MSTPTSHDGVRIDPHRLIPTIREYAEIGATPHGGVTRLALSDEDRDARNLLARHLHELDCDVLVDDLGNMRGVMQGQIGNAPVLIGSHLDSVTRGGRFDGALGVLAGLEILRTLRERSISAERTIELINWTNEEGARFEPAMVGSGGATGVFSGDWVRDRTGRDGARLGDELGRIGYRGEKRHRPPVGYAYLELHIEQGPVLDDLDRPIGVVEGILGITWIDVTITGAASHAGPTPMAARRDALLAAADVIQSVRRIGESAGTPAAGTIGRLSVEPGLVNVVPGEVTMSVDFRAREMSLLDDMVREFAESVDEIGQRHGVTIELNRFWTSSPVAFSTSVIETLESSCYQHGVEPVRLWSGAGHDARHAADVQPTGMLFVRSRGGVSHCEEELSDDDDVVLAANILLRAALALASVEVPAGTGGDPG